MNINSLTVFQKLQWLRNLKIQTSLEIIENKHIIINAEIIGNVYFNNIQTYIEDTQVARQLKAIKVLQDLCYVSFLIYLVYWK